MEGDSEEQVQMNAVEGFYPRYQKGGGAADNLETETQILLALE